MIDTQSIKTIDLIPPPPAMVSPPTLASSSSSTPGKLLAVYHKIIHQTLHQVQGFDSKTIESLRKHWMDELPVIYDLPSEPMTPNNKKKMKVELVSPQPPPPPSPITAAMVPSPIPWQPPPMTASKSLLTSLFFGDDINDDATPQPPPLSFPIHLTPSLSLTIPSPLHVVSPSVQQLSTPSPSPSSTNNKKKRYRNQSEDEQQQSLRSVFTLEAMFNENRKTAYYSSINMLGRSEAQDYVVGRVVSYKSTKLKCELTLSNCLVRIGDHEFFVHTLYLLCLIA